MCARQVWTCRGSDQVSGADKRRTQTGSELYGGQPAGRAKLIKTTCTPESSSTVVGGCASPAPVDPSWETVTCTAIAGTGTDNTLADVAAYYYKTDLRTWALGNCTGSAVPPGLARNNLLYGNRRDEQRAGDDDRHQLSSAYDHVYAGSGGIGLHEIFGNLCVRSFGRLPTRFAEPARVMQTPVSGPLRADPGNGICSWQAGSNCNWPFPTKREQTTH